MISVRELARAADASSSHVAAERAVASGRAAREILAAVAAVNRHSGLTSKELAEATEDIGRDMLGQDGLTWRQTLGRRLPNAEDRDLITAIGPSYSKARPLRPWDREIKPCSISGVRSIRWERKGSE